MNNIISLILIIASLGLSFFYTYPKWRSETGMPNLPDKSITELKAERDRYESALKQVREIEDLRNSLLTRYNSIDEVSRKKLLKFFPDNLDSVRLIIDINNIASAYGMSMDNIELSDSSLDSGPRKDEVGFVDMTNVGQEEKYATKILDFTLAGPYDNFIAFLKDIERSLRLVDIRSVSVEVSSDDSTESLINLYKYNFSIQTYYLKQK